MPPLGVDPTPWEILGVPEGSSAAIVRTAWRLAVRSYHPDHVGGGDIEKFHAANGAYRELEASFGQLRGTHPVETSDLGDLGPAPDAPSVGDAEELFGFLDGPPVQAPDEDGPMWADAPEPAPPARAVDLVAEPDPDAVFEATIDRLLGDVPRRSWRARRSASPPAPRVERPAGPPGPAELDSGTGPEHQPVPDRTADGRVDAELSADEPRRTLADRAAAIERPHLASSTLVGAGCAVAFVAWRSLVQVVAPGAFAVPLGVVVLAGFVVGSLCWFVAQRLGADEGSKPAFAAAAAAVVILGAVDILLLVAVPILLVVAVTYAVIHQRRSR